MTDIKDNDWYRAEWEKVWEAFHKVGEELNISTIIHIFWTGHATLRATLVFEEITLTVEGADAETVISQMGDLLRQRQGLLKQVENILVQPCPGKTIYGNPCALLAGHAGEHLTDES